MDVHQLKVNIRFFRLGIHTHGATTVSPFRVIAVPWLVRVEHPAQEEFVLHLVYSRLQTEHPLGLNFLLSSDQCLRPST